MFQIVKDLLGITTTEFDWLIVTFCMMWISLGVIYIFSLMTVPVNMITNGFERSKRQ